MSEIKILDSSIFNRIAAGEVVESPVSIVKELIENSIDAGADAITVEIKGGGIDFIKITDNGKGISAKDLPLAFMPHATSKIKSIEDLEVIKTLGFRGEALPSIASVSKITMTSRTAAAENQTGYCVAYENGTKIFESEAGSPIGTTVVVENVFNNIPARKKFLKKPSLEGARISSLIEKLILANYNISFKFIDNGKIVFHSSGKGMEQAIYNVYSDFFAELDYIDSTMPDITLKGYISKPSFSKHNKSYQTLIVNGRIVENEDISYYIYLCCQEYLMKRQYPVYILFLNVPYDMIDVNVHPNKLNVKFSDLNRIKTIVMGAVKKSVQKEFLIPKNIIHSESVIVTKLNPNEEIYDNQQKNETVITSDYFTNSNNSTQKDKYLNQNSGDLLSKAQNFDPVLRETGSKNHILASEKNPKNDNLSYMNTYLRDNAVYSQTTVLSTEKDSIICGKIFNTYLIVQQSSDIYLIDQHAAHEKILYDKLIKAIDSDNTAVQNLLIPFVFDVNNYEKQELLEKLPEFEKLGFIISEFGTNSFALSAIPVLCMNLNLKEFTSKIIENLKNSKFKKSEFIKESIMQTACKAAVKGNDDLKNEEAEKLIFQMKETGGALFCPHGRPIVVRVSKTEIEKWFKRIT